MSEWASPSLNGDPDTTTEEGRCQYAFTVHIRSLLQQRRREAEARGEDSIPIDDIDWERWWDLYEAGWRAATWAREGLEVSAR